MAKRREATWVTVGPSPHAATCRRCGRTIPQPPIPISLKGWVRYMDLMIEEHADCKEDEMNNVQPEARGDAPSTARGS